MSVLKTVDECKKPSCILRETLRSPLWLKIKMNKTERVMSTEGEAIVETSHEKKRKCCCYEY